VTFDLTAQALQWLPKKFLDFAAGQTNDVRVFLLAPSLVVVLFARLMHQIKLIHQTALLQQLESPIDSDAIELGVLLPRHSIKPFSVEVFPGFVDQIEQNLALTRETHTGGAVRFIRDSFESPGHCGLFSLAPNSAFFLGHRSYIGTRIAFS